MPRGKQSKGVCAYCQQEIAKGSVAKHLAKCEQRRNAVLKAEQGKREIEPLYHLRIQAMGLNAFWLDLEVRGSATLKDLDHSRDLAGMLWSPEPIFGGRMGRP
jgi:hypothetical protein